MQDTKGCSVNNIQTLQVLITKLKRNRKQYFINTFYNKLRTYFQLLNTKKIQSTEQATLSKRCCERILSLYNFFNTIQLCFLKNILFKYQHKVNYLIWPNTIFIAWNPIIFNNNNWIKLLLSPRIFLIFSALNWSCYDTDNL